MAPFKNIKARICSKALRALSFQRRRRLLLQKVNLREPRDSILKHAIIPFCKVETDVAMNWFAEEARTRHRAELHFFSQVEAELIVVVVAEFTDVHQDKIRALRAEIFEAEPVQAGEENLTAMRVFSLKLLVIIVAELEAYNCSFLQRR